MEETEIVKEAFDDFYGALCTDISPAESMDEYFPDYGDAGFILFN